MKTPPAGTVTFLFSDVEGSTRRWQDEPEAMRALLAEHDAIWRAVLDKHAGYMFKHTGDGVAAVFASAADGVNAAVDAQQRLVDVLPVRVGVHSGEAEPREGDYFGVEVNRAARVMSVAHGGQVVCSGAVREHLRDRVDVVDLGEHRLRDLSSPVHLFQIDVPGAANVFPPLRSLDAYRSNLPHELSTFIGRDEEIRGLADRLDSSRVVSIVGVGGVGKTRLALQVASELLPRYPDGVWLCELAPVLDGGAVPDAVAAAVGYAPPQGVPLAEGLQRFLERKVLLLVLDNCEHLLGAVSRWVTATTAAAANVSVLATSREALGVRGEQLWPLASLALPDAMSVVSVLGSESGALFAARAAAVRGSFAIDEANAAAVGELCIRLDGIPLAIELAAARAKVMSPAEIVQRLDRQFRLLSGGRNASLERHQTLRAAIDWSYDLLDEGERQLLRHLSVCIGGFDLAAAAALAAGFGVDEFDAFELLASLVAKSLVEHTERDGTTRYRMLEMIRQYAREQLTTAGEVDAAREHHAGHYLACALDLFAQTATPADYAALARIEIETPNIAAAGRWLLSVDRADEVLAFFEQLPFLVWFAWPPATVDELGAIAAEAIELAAPTAPGREAACAVAAAPVFMAGDLVAYRRIGEIARATGGAAPAAHTSNLVGTVAMFDGDVELMVSSVRAAAERARLERDPALLAYFLGLRALAETMAATGPSIATAEECVRVARATGSAIVLQNALNFWLAVCQLSAHPGDERALAEELLRMDRTRRRTWAGTARSYLGTANVEHGEVVAGLEQFREVLAHHHQRGEHVILSVQIANLAGALAEIEPAAAIELAMLCESEVVAPYRAFTLVPRLATLAAARPKELEAARNALRGRDDDEAIAFLFTTIDRLIDKHG